MNDEQKEWYKQYSSNLGAKEILRLGCAIMLWIFIGLGISTSFALAGYSNSSIIIVIFFIMLFVFPSIAYSRKPMYSLLRKILGNKILPVEPMPHSTMKIPRQPLAWYGYLPGIWGWLMGLALLYAVIRYLSSK
ncbi:MAG TPA: hypothetical protein VN653_05005 [Anaerolineales bacterium]|nr:hypothetical protein [Anaerolineales bacterium]